ncbi:MAG TPA: DUF3592 domain-containing protein [Candidatus Saccharimonadales bacterium]
MGFWDAASKVLDGFGALIGIVSILSGLLAAFIAVLGLRAFIYRLREAAGIVRSWPRTEATITEVNEVASLIPGEGNNLIGSYIFTDVTGKEFSGTDVEPVIKEPSVGMRIGIVYDSKDPMTSHPTKRIKLRITGWAVLFVIVECLLFGCACLLFTIGFGAIF